jgi:hypothetical protein
MNRDLVVEVYDTFPTVCSMLAIPVTRKPNGKFVEDILADRELLKRDTTAATAATQPVMIPGAAR